MAGEKKLHALVVDDDPVTQLCHRVMLNRFKCESFVAENGKEAIDLYRCGAKIDLVFMDMEMPVMDGLQATKELRAMGYEGPIVGVTSQEIEFAKRVFNEAGADACYEKPLSLDQVSSILEEMIHNN